MKLIGLLGGTSWPSTPLYYRYLNEMVQARLGGFHSAEILLRSIDYAPIKSRYGDDETVGKLLRERLDDLVARQPDCIIICCNTLHKMLDQIGYAASCPVPIFHAVEQTGLALQRAGHRRVLLLATPHTMQDGFYARGLERFGITCQLPDADQQKELGRVQQELASGQRSPDHVRFFQRVISAWPCDAVVLACTELPLGVTQADVDVPLFDSAHTQCVAAVDFALEA